MTKNKAKLWEIVGRVGIFKELSFEKSPNELKDRKMFKKKNNNKTNKTWC